MNVLDNSIKTIKSNTRYFLLKSGRQSNVPATVCTGETMMRRLYETSLYSFLKNQLTGLTASNLGTHENCCCNTDDNASTPYNTFFVSISTSGISCRALFQSIKISVSFIWEKAMRFSFFKNPVFTNALVYAWQSGQLSSYIMALLKGCRCI